MWHTVAPMQVLWPPATVPLMKGQGAWLSCITQMPSAPPLPWAVAPELSGRERASLPFLAPSGLLLADLP